jgi:hypothetical protein
MFIRIHVYLIIINIILFSTGSYAEERLEYLEAERKKFNVDNLQRYKGGGL